eukprot:195034-Amphidinium_carterae.1
MPVSSLDDPVVPELEYLDSTEREPTRIQKDRAQSRLCVGGLRSARAAVLKLPGMVPAGMRLRLALLKVFKADPDIVPRCLAQLGRTTLDGCCLTASQLQACQSALAESLGAPWPPSHSSTSP